MNLKDSLVSFVVLLAFLGAGEGVVRLLGVAFPGSVVGMVLLALCLITGLIPIHVVQRSADLLLSQLGLLFVPPGVAFMLYFDLVALDWLALVAGTIASLVAVLWTTALTAQFLVRRNSK